MMSGNQITSCIFLSILCATGYFIYDNYNETLIETKKFETNTQLAGNIIQHDEKMLELFNMSVNEIKNTFKEK